MQTVPFKQVHEMTQKYCLMTFRVMEITALLGGFLSLVRLSLGNIKIQSESVEL